MNIVFTRLAAGALFLSVLSLTACNNDETRTVIKPGGAPTLTGSANNLTLTKPTSGDNAVTYTWTPVDFGYQSVVTYTLQFDKQGDNFANPSSYAVGSALTKTFTVGELNSIYVGYGLDSNTPSPIPLDVRVVASVGTTAPKPTSAVSSITATPYSSCDQPATANEWSLIGPAGNGWDTGDDIDLTYDCKSKTFTFTGALKADDFKFRYGHAWTANLGGASSTGGALTQNGSNLHIATAGTYTIVLTPAAIVGGTVSDGSTFTIK